MAVRYVMNGFSVEGQTYNIIANRFSRNGNRLIRHYQDGERSNGDAIFSCKVYRVEVETVGKLEEEIGEFKIPRRKIRDQNLLREKIISIVNNKARDDAISSN